MTATADDSRIKRWHNALNTRAHLQIARLTVLESNVFAEQTIEFDRLTALAGGHGTGKSLLIRVLHAALGTDRFVDSSFFADLRQPGNDDPKDSVMQSKLSLTILVEGRAVTRTVDLSTDWEERGQMWADALGEPITMDHINPVDMMAIMGFFTSNYNRSSPWLTGEALATYRTHSYSKAELDAVRNILGRHYESVQVYGVPEDDSQIWVDPWFRAVSEPTQAVIATETMSLGELWVHWLLGWKMGYNQLGACGWLVDEPEAFLSARGHRPLLDEMVRRALDKRAQLIVASHSPAILKRFPNRNIRLCVRRGEKLMIGPLTNDVDSLGLLVPDQRTQLVLVFVEDKFAALILELLCTQFDSSLADQIDIVAAGGHSKVARIVNLTRPSSRVLHMGVLDGNARSEPLPKDVSKDVWERMSFLPGKREPEAELLAAADSMTESLAQSLGVSAWSIRVAIDECRDLDHQYVIDALARRLVRRRDVLVTALVAAWLQMPTVSEQARQLVSLIRSQSDASQHGKTTANG